MRIPRFWIVLKQMANVVCWFPAKGCCQCPRRRRCGPRLSAGGGEGADLGAERVGGQLLLLRLPPPVLRLLQQRLPVPPVLLPLPVEVRPDLPAAGRRPRGGVHVWSSAPNGPCPGLSRPVTPPGQDTPNIPGCPPPPNRSPRWGYYHRFT